MEVEVDRVLVAPRGAMALDVDDVDVVENRHVDRVPGLVAEPLQMRRGDLPELHRVDRGEAQIEDPCAERVLPRARVLMEIPEARERGHVPVRRAPREPELARQLADPDLLAPGGERGENRQPALEG